MTRKNTPPNPVAYRPRRTTRRPKAEVPGPEVEASPPIEEPTPDLPVVPRINKTEAVIAMLRRPEGASVDEIMAATDWQRHSVRGALAGSVKKRLGAAVTSEMVDGVRRYRAPGAVS